MRALLLGTRAGLVAGELAGDASRAAALRLAVYRQALALLSAGGARELGEDEAGRLAEALAAELGSMISPVDLSEVRATGGSGVGWVPVHLCSPPGRQDRVPVMPQLPRLRSLLC